MSTLLIPLLRLRHWTSLAASMVAENVVLQRCTGTFLRTEYLYWNILAILYWNIHADEYFVAAEYFILVFLIELVLQSAGGDSRC